MASVIEEPAHAKHVSDGLASEIGNKIRQLLKSGFSALAGTRNQVLILAQVYPNPQGDAGNKKGMWAASRCMYAFYSPEVLSANIEDFKATKGSKKFRFRVGLNQDESRVKDGKLTMRQNFCACSSCYAPNFDFQNCEFKNLVGRALSGFSPPIRPVGVFPAVMEIANFARSLKAGDIRAVDAAADQVEIEGAPFWICLLVDSAFQAAAPVLFAGESFDAGFYLVKIRYFEFAHVDASGQRIYRLTADERMISVHSLIRCEPIKLVKPKEPPQASRGRKSPADLFLLTKSECGRVAEYASIQDFDFDD